MWTVILLTISNIFMTFAWYGHLKYRDKPLAVVILASWGIAFFEYCFQVPANRIGYGEFNGAQLKTIQDGHHTFGLCCFFCSISERAVPLELRGRLRNDCRRCVRHLPQMVSDGD